MKLGPVIDFSDAAIFSMALVNIIRLYFLACCQIGIEELFRASSIGRDQTLC